MENAIITISGVRAYLDAEGTAWLNVEDVARGLGFVMVRKDRVTGSCDSSAEDETTQFYTAVRWNTVNEYLSSFGYPHKVSKEDYIPENMFYRLAMKAKNETAEKFQAKVADEILPAIRKYGFYATEVTLEKMIANPDFAIELFQALKAERAEKQALRNIVGLQAVQIAEMRPKVSYYDLVLQSSEALPISVIAKDYGYSAKKMNKLLRDKRIQYKVGKTWLVYQNYAEEGYTCTKTFALDDGETVTHTYWTQKGRLFLYDTLKKYGILPLIEQNDDDE